ncbi:MAG: hypothetical protein POG24_01905 [Acidocella sp.]|nr:hypothetical protein [Acidocella sp.]
MQWNHTFADAERFTVGGIEASVLFSPGHTPASITCLIGDAAIMHDTLFMLDSGTVRAEFPGESAKQLWVSIQAVLSLPRPERNGRRYLKIPIDPTTNTNWGGAP